MNIVNKKIWFIADFHFGHDNVIRYCNRPFKTTTEMNTAMIKNFNKVVGKNDVVYILGDISWLNTQSTKQIIKSLNGFKFLVKGNHDRKGNQYYRNMGFIEVYDHPIILDDKIALSHRPLYTNYLNIHGHTHNVKENKKGTNNFCVSVEMINYTPISLQEIVEQNKDEEEEEIIDKYVINDCW